jgi:hypothetical protein
MSDNSCSSMDDSPSFSAYGIVYARSEASNKQKTTHSEGT